jgi:hypothetical protein
MVAEDADFVAADWFAAHDVTLSKYYSGMAQMRNQLRWRYGEAADASRLSRVAVNPDLPHMAGGMNGRNKMELIYLIGFVWWLVLAVGVGATARERGDDFVWWFFVALMVSTPLALLYLIASPIKPVKTA